jgi:hypothetical protein
LGTVRLAQALGSLRAVAWSRYGKSYGKCYDAKVWLGLTHLHTLRGVDLGVVSATSIAAALPRLHIVSGFYRRKR